MIRANLKNKIFLSLLTLRDRRKQFQDGERSERSPEVAKTIVNGNEVK
ncbi:MAG: hypothetical protein ACI4CY_03285 [Candidatus Gastranaerophilaceae bacterium]